MIISIYNPTNVKKFISLVAVSALVLNTALIAQSQLTGFFSQNVQNQLNRESLFDKNIDRGHIDDLIQKLSSQPYHFASAADKKVTAQAIQKLAAWPGDQTQ